MTTGENAMMEGNMQNITSTGSYLTWCNDKTCNTCGHKKYPDMPFWEGVADRQMLE